MKGQACSGKAEDRRYFKEVRFRQIRALFEISRQGSFAAAARSLGMATPSVWRQVRGLEDDNGVRFVAAKVRAVRLTEDGERLMRLAAPASVLNSPLRHVIAAYRLAHLEVRLTLIDSPSRVAYPMVESDTADLAIVGVPSGVELSVEPSARYPFEVIFPEGHLLGKPKRGGLRDILAHPLVLAGEDSSSRPRFDQVVAEAGLAHRDVSAVLGHDNIVLVHPKGRHELGHIRIFREMAAASLKACA
jgi:DNA-binding transcriptional LysR family regulator